MKQLFPFLGLIICLVLASVYIYPVFSGLVLLPLDLLVSDSGPWHWASTIFLKNPYMKDSILQMFPWKHLTFASLSSGILPLWNPYQFMGMPFMAGMKSLVFYPANIFFVFGEVASWNLLLWLQLFLSAWFTYLLAGSLGLTGVFGLFAAISFAFSSLMVGVLQFGSEGHVLLWLPLLLYLVKRDFRWTIPFVVATLIFAGHLQYAAYVIATAIAFAYIHSPKRRIIFAIVLGLGIAAIQLLPGIELFRQSYRGIADSYTIFTSGLLQPYHLLRLLTPDWLGNPVTRDLRGGYIEASGYFGIIALFFALYAPIAAWKNLYVKFFTWTAVGSLLLSMNGIAQMLYFLRIPIITSGYGSRIFAIFLFSGAMLAGFGLRTFTEGIGPRKRAVGFYLVIVGLLFLLGLVAGRWNAPYALILTNAKIQIVSIIVFGVAAGVYLAFQQKIRFAKELFVLLLLVLLYGDLFRMGYRFLTFSNTKYLYPDLSVTKFIRQEQKNSLERTYGITEPELESVFGIYGVETYNPLYPLRTAKLLQALEATTGNSLPVNKYYLSQPDRMKYAHDFLGVSMIAVRTGRNPALDYWGSAQYEKDITKIYSYEGNDIYRNVGAYPRFALFFDPRGNTPDEEALFVIANKTKDLRRILLVKEALTQTYAPGSGAVELVSSGLNTISFRVVADNPAVLYLSDTHFPGWHASVNGNRVPILHGNYNFRAVEVPSGASTVSFWYLPSSFLIGGVISAISMMTAVILLMKRPVKKERGT